MPRFFAWLRKKGQAGILDNIVFSIGFSVLASALIYWGVLEQTAIALPLIALLLAGLFFKGAFSEPAKFWHGTLEGLETMLYSDTRGDIGTSGREGLLGSTFMGMFFPPAGRHASGHCWAQY